MAATVYKRDNICNEGYQFNSIQGNSHLYKQCSKSSIQRPLYLICPPTPHPFQGKKVNKPPLSFKYQMSSSYSALRASVWSKNKGGRALLSPPLDPPLIRIQLNPFTTDTQGAIESGLINGVSVLSGFNLEKNVRAFFPQGQSKLSVITRCPYQAGFDYICNGYN